MEQVKDSTEERQPETTKDDGTQDWYRPSFRPSLRTQDWMGVKLGYGNEGWKGTQKDKPDNGLGLFYPLYMVYRGVLGFYKILHRDGCDYRLSIGQPKHPPPPIFTTS